MIAGKPLTGWGLGAYKKELPRVSAEINETRTFRAASTLARNKGIEMNRRSARVHNDHLEIMAEVGIPGYLLYLYLFANLSIDPLVLGLIVAFATSAFFFFPFREVHLAAPFWALMGSASPAAFTPVFLPLPLKLTVLAILVIIAAKALHFFLGQWYSERAKYDPGLTAQQRLALIDEALLHEPRSGHYLSDAAFAWAKVNPVKAFNYACRALVDYDGNRELHGVHDLFARDLIAAGESNVCAWAENRALWLSPGFEPALVIKNYLASRRTAAAAARKERAA
jgi:hypothetical protein